MVTNRTVLDSPIHGKITVFETTDGCKVLCMGERKSFDITKDEYETILYPNVQLLPEHSYAREMLIPNINSVLIIGAGMGQIVKLYQHYTTTDITSTEICPEIMKLCVKYTDHIPALYNVLVYGIEENYDVIVVDAFDTQRKAPVRQFLERKFLSMAKQHTKRLLINGYGLTSRQLANFADTLDKVGAIYHTKPCGKDGKHLVLDVNLVD